MRIHLISSPAIADSCKCTASTSCPGYGTQLQCPPLIVLATIALENALLGASPRGVTR
jgi:hypothetical protein